MFRIRIEINGFNQYYAGDEVSDCTWIVRFAKKFKRKCDASRVVNAKFEKNHPEFTAYIERVD